MHLKTSVSILLMLLLYACEGDRSQSSATVDFRAPTFRDTLTFSGVMPGMPVRRLLFPDSIDRAVTSRQLSSSLGHLRRLQVGDWETVRKEFELPLEWGLDTLVPAEAEKLRDFSLHDAREYVLERAEEHKLLIVAESHQKPQHRVFTRRLLEELWARGYRHLGLETLLPFPKGTGGALVDSAMQERGYPMLTVLSGTYTAEPQYANMIREATRIGFRLFAHERNGSSDSERDLQQAEHIVAYQRKYPGEKIICHVGWYHAIETELVKRTSDHYMAWHYRQLTGDDPLTVYLDALDEKTAAAQLSSPYYQLIIDRTNLPKTPQVLLNDDGEIWRGPGEGVPFDVLVWHPLISYANGLPNWLHPELDGYDGKEQLADIPEGLLEGLKLPAIVSVRESFASEVATPIFARTQVQGNSLLKVPLSPGEYWFRAESIDGSVKELESRVQ